MLWSLLATAPLLLAAADTPEVAPPAHASPHPWVTACKNWDEWDKPSPPFRIHGNTWYVGTCGISSILITTPEGHVLIDSGTEAGAEVVLANIAALGFDPKDVKLLLHSHEHFDHVGGMARLRAATGARVIASPEAAIVLGTGEDAPGDPQFGLHPPMTPVPVDGLVMDGEQLTIGDLVLTAIATPGHTPGALSWHWRSCEDSTANAGSSACRAMVYADSLTPISNETYRFTDHPEYLGAFYQGLGRLAATECDTLLTPHPSSSSMREKLETGALGRETDRPCEAYLKAVNSRLANRLVQETEPQEPAATAR